MKCLNCKRKLGNFETQNSIKTCFYCDLYVGKRLSIKKIKEYIKRLFNISINY